MSTQDILLLSNVVIVIEGPHKRKGHLSTLEYFKVAIVNLDTHQEIDLTPWNERGAMSRGTADRIAAEAAEVTGYMIVEYEMKETIHVERVLVKKDAQ